MPHLRQPMELGAPPSLLRRATRALVIASIAIAVFVAGLSIVVLVTTR
ncbi:hypothetical protein L6R52_39580 [Myxococcota bacterium]|nr:hypothetical protein [Myxococcota bacterium]